MKNHNSLPFWLVHIDGCPKVKGKYLDQNSDVCAIFCDNLDLFIWCFKKGVPCRDWQLRPAPSWLGWEWGRGLDTVQTLAPNESAQKWGWFLALFLCSGSKTLRLCLFRSAILSKQTSLLLENMYSSGKKLNQTPYLLQHTYKHTTTLCCVTLIYLVIVSLYDLR